MTEEKISIEKMAEKHNLDEKIENTLWYWNACLMKRVWVQIPPCPIQIQKE